MDEPKTIEALSRLQFEGKKLNCLEFSEFCPGYLVVGNYILHKSQPEDGQKASTKENSGSNDNEETELPNQEQIITGYLSLCKLTTKETSIGDLVEV